MVEGKCRSVLSRPAVHKKAISLQLPPTPDFLECELFSVRSVREKVARKSHFDLETYFQASSCSPRKPGEGRLAIPSLNSPKSKPFVELEPVNSKILSLNKVSKHSKVIKRLRNMHTFLPPVSRPRPSSRDELIRDSLLLLRMKRQLSSYLLNGPKQAFDYYCRRTIADSAV